MNIKVLSTAIIALTIGIGAGFVLGNQVADSEHSRSALSHDSMMVEFQAHIAVSELDFLVRSLRSAQKRDYKASQFENCQLVRLKLRSIRDVKASVFDKTEKNIILQARKKADEIGCNA
jgi:hypothetical protein